jgi:hypothetical protein
MTTNNNIDNFVVVAINNLSNSSSSSSDINYFENYLKNYGKELDESFTFSFLIDNDNNGNLDNSSPFTTINEINIGFNKSKLLFTPKQFEYMKIHNNVFIENPAPGDWLSFNVNNIEEGLINLKDKNQRNKEDTIKHSIKITEKIPR